MEQELLEPPKDPRARELWLQHAAGLIVFRDIRRYAMEQMDPALTGKAREAAVKGINDAIYGLMMVIDGVAGGISNEEHNVYIDFVVRLASRGKNQRVLSEVDLRNGDGMCMGYHGWLGNDFGKVPVAKPTFKVEG